LTLQRDRRIAILFAAVTLLHLANAPVVPLVGRYIARLGGANTQVACVVLVAQAIMIAAAVFVLFMPEKRTPLAATLEEM
jgi:hypothetical protein